MAEHTLPGVIKLEGGWDDLDNGWGANFNRNLRILGALVHGAFIDFVAELPAAPTNGDIYIYLGIEDSNSGGPVQVNDSNSTILTAAQVNAFQDSNSGMVTDFRGYVFVRDDGAWYAIQPAESMVLFAAATGTWWRYFASWPGDKKWIPVDLTDGRTHEASMTALGTISAGQMIGMFTYPNTVFYDVKGNEWGDPGTLNAMTAGVKDSISFNGNSPRGFARVTDATPLVLGIYYGYDDTQIGTITFPSSTQDAVFDYFPEDSNSTFFGVEENEVRSLSNGDNIYIQEISGGGGTWEDVTITLNGRTF